jgi:hypothetical protein
MLNVIQHGTDGFGHQLHGLVSVLALHGNESYKFDGDFFINKNFSFEHVKVKDMENLKNYMIAAVKAFMEDHPVELEQQQQYKRVLHVHEVYAIPHDYDPLVLYTLDNSYYFDRIPRITDFEESYANNMKNFARYFTTSNPYLKPSFLERNSIVIHVRLGDAEFVRTCNHHSKLRSVITKLKQSEKYRDYKIYVHSDGNNFLGDMDVCFKNRSTPVDEVLSDFIHAKVFVCGTSSLSLFAATVGTHELVIIPDNTKHSIVSHINSVRVSEFIK